MQPLSHLDAKTIQDMLTAGQYDILRRTIAETDPADVADLMEDLTPDEVELVFSILDNELASEVIVEMESGEIEEVVETLAPDRLAGMLQEMAPDDAVDILNEMDAKDQNTVLHFLDPEKKEELQELAEYDPDSAGGLMTPEFYAVSDQLTVAEAIQSLAGDDFDDPVTMVFAIDEKEKLVGSLHISELISLPGEAKLRDLVDTQLITATVDEPASDVARKVRKYDLMVIPVIDQDGKLLGRITVDDVLDFIDDEAAEDMAKMAGAPDIEQREESPLSIVRLRLPWLLITMITGSVVSVIMQQLLELPAAASLAAFVPVILGMGGNTGTQSAAVTVRNIAIGQIEFTRLLSVLFRELLVGAVMGAVCGILIAAVVYVNLAILAESPIAWLPLLEMMGAVALSMFTAMTFAAFSGATMPIVLHKINIDPAVASGPFISTGNDLSASLIYLGMCSILL